MKDKFIINKLKNMTLQEKIGQMIMIDYREVKEINIELEKLLTKYAPGGFIVFSSNISNFNQTKKFLSDIKSTGDIPLTI